MNKNGPLFESEDGSFLPFVFVCSVLYAEKWEMLYLERKMREIYLYKVGSSIYCLEKSKFRILTKKICQEKSSNGLCNRS